MRAITMRCLQFYLVVGLLFGMGGLGCQDISSTAVEWPTAVPPASSITLLPQEANPGDEVDVLIEGISTAFNANTTLDLGEGITSVAITVESPWRIHATLRIDPAITRGYRDLIIRDPEGVHRLDEALLIQDGAFSIHPARGHRGQSVNVEVRVDDIDLIPTYTWADFGAGTTTTRFDIIDENLARAEVLIDATAVPGLRDVAILNGSERVRRGQAFTIDRELISIRFDPPVVSQGQGDVRFVITGQGTSFEAGKTTVDLGTGVVVNEKDDPTAMVVESPTRITGLLQVCRGALPGVHDVEVQTQGDGGREVVGIAEALTVVAVPPRIEESYAYAYLSFSRAVRLGELDESVNAYAVFQTQGGPCGEDDDLYPPPPTLDAGPYVHLIRDDGTRLRLDRELDSDGTFSYTPSAEIPLDFYDFGARYSLEYPGTAEGLDPHTLEAIIHTPSAAFSVTHPDLSYAPTLNPYDSIEVRWQDDEGNPGAGAGILDRLQLTLSTVPPIEGDSGRISEILAEDTGYYLISADRVAEDLTPGAGNLSLRTVRVGEPYSLPGSSILVQSYATVSYAGYFEMRE